jgi:hypothetical protein
MTRHVWFMFLVACNGGSSDTDAGNDASIDVYEASVDVVVETSSDASDATSDVVDEDVTVVEAGPSSIPWGVDVGFNSIALGASTTAGVVASGGADQYGTGLLSAWDVSGNVLWTHGAGFIYAVAVAPTGDVYVTGYAPSASTDFGGGAVGSAGAVLVKYDSKGTYQWLLGPLSNSSVLTRVAVKSNGDVVAAGQFAGTANFGNGNVSSVGSYYDILLVELTSSKGYVRANLYGGGGDQYVSALAIGPSDEIVMAGTFEGDVDFGGGKMTGPGESAGTASFLVALDASAGFLHQLQLDPGLSAGGINGLDIDAQGNIGVCGSFNNTIELGKTLYAAGSNDVFAGVLDSTFAVKWSKRFGDAQEQDCYAAAFDSTKALVLGGRVTGNLNFGLGYLIGPSGYYVRLDATGTALTQGYVTGTPQTFLPFIAPDLVGLVQTSGTAHIANANANVKSTNAAVLRFMP